MDQRSSQMLLGDLSIQSRRRVMRKRIHGFCILRRRVRKANPQIAIPIPLTQDSSKTNQIQSGTPTPKNPHFPNPKTSNPTRKKEMKMKKRKMRKRKMTMTTTSSSPKTKTSSQTCSSMTTTSTTSTPNNSSPPPTAPHSQNPTTPANQTSPPSPLPTTTSQPTSKKCGNVTVTPRNNANKTVKKHDCTAYLERRGWPSRRGRRRAGK